MAYKTVLTFCDTSPHLEKQLAVAAEMARRFDGHLVGVNLRGNFVLPAYMEAGVGPELLMMQEKRGKEQAAKARAAFDKAINEFGVPGEWRESAGDVYRLAAMHARYADLVVMGQPDPSLKDPDIVPDLPETVALDAGRPILMVPYIGVQGPVGRNVLIGWNASREATRALRDALPLLRQAENVLVIAVNPRGGAAGHGEEPGADIARYLARHDVKVTATHAVAEDVDPAELMLSRVADLGVDMVVMGAYGHSRLREMVLGGVTRKMLRSMTVPLFLSH